MPPTKPRPPHLTTGEQAEQRALAHLQAQGLRWVASNFRCRFGELDLLMQDQQTLVVVEVRYRKSDHYGTALESVTATKQARIIAATQVYLAANRVTSAVRFDVVALSGDGRLQWVKNAF